MIPAGRFADELTAALSAEATPERAENEKRYLKSDLEFLGATVPTIRATTKRMAPDLAEVNHGALCSLVDELWRRGVHELRMAAVELLTMYPGLLERADLATVESLVRTSGTWALVDPLAATVAGRIVEADPAAAEVLDAWATDEDFWVRRSALLALLGPLRRGEGDFGRFARYADAMLEEKEFFIRKAIGWVLRETGKRCPELVDRWLAPRTHRASGVTIREAVKPLTPERQAELMTAYRERRPAQPT